MSKKLAGRGLRFWLLCLLLLGATFGAFSTSGTFAQGGGDPIEIEGGGLVCVPPVGCQQWGCSGNGDSQKCILSGNNCPTKNCQPAQ